MFVRCPFCHRWVFRWFYKWHEAKHTARRSDGQMSEHITAPPQDRHTGSLDGVPRAYLHSVCGVATGMPEEIIRTYLVNPMTYGDGSFCCGCGDYIESSQLVWQETGEKVMDYMGRLRLEYLRKTLGLNLPDRPGDLVITPRAARKLKDVLRDAGSSAACILLEFQPAANFKLDVVELADESFYKVIDFSGLKVAVDSSHAKRIAGIVIDFLEAPATGFSISRLYAPG